MKRRHGKPIILDDRILIKFVKVAKMWCRTHWDEQGVQIQAWSIEKPNE